jgi:Ca2+/H+ antiporter
MLYQKGKNIQQGGRKSGVDFLPPHLLRLLFLQEKKRYLSTFMSKLLISVYTLQRFKALKRLLYVYEMTHPEGNEEKNKSEVKIETLAQVTRIHNIDWSKEKNGVKVGYKGNLKTWTGTLDVKYNA